MEYSLLTKPRMHDKGKKTSHAELYEFVFPLIDVKVDLARLASHIDVLFSGDDIQLAFD